MADYIYVDFFIDTGCPVTTITRDVYLKLGLTEVCKSPLLIHSLTSPLPLSLSLSFPLFFHSLILSTIMLLLSLPSLSLPLSFLTLSSFSPHSLLTLLLLSLCLLNSLGCLMVIVCGY